MPNDEPRWVVLIEEETNRQQNGRQIVPWSLEQSYPDETTALQAAWDLARTHTPRHPMSPRERTVVQHDDRSYTVVVSGSWYTFHFRVSTGLAYRVP